MVSGPGMVRRAGLVDDQGSGNRIMISGESERGSAAGREARLSKLSVARRRSFILIAVFMSVALVFGTLEIGCRVSEVISAKQHYRRGEGGIWLPDPRWGWKPAQGHFAEGTAEFTVEGQINSLHMNDLSFDSAAEADRVRVLTLGDSHTYAVGVSTTQTWVKVLERRLNDAAGGVFFRTLNAAAPGYSLHQYLMRLVDQGPGIRPQYVLVGLSYATDFYDLLPPERGGWIYGGDLPRHYFDFNQDGRLIEKVWELTVRDPAQTEGRSKGTLSAQTIRQVLDRFAIFRILRRSKLALFVGSRLRIGGQSLWPNMDVVLEREVRPEHEYQNRLAFALLTKIKEESRRLGAQLIVVGIPYLPQVYDDVWRGTFGGSDRYSRTAAMERVARFCVESDIPYVDTLAAFQQRVKQQGRWMHFRRDAHPTPEGHEVIADAVISAGVIDVGGSTQW